MAKLVTLDNIRVRGALQEIPEITIAIESSLEASVFDLQSLLDTTFSRESKTDTFWVDTDQKPFEGGYPKLRLSKALVDPAQTVTVEYASSLENFSQDKETLKPFQFVLNANHGVVSLLEVDVDKTWVRVTYTAGIAIDSADSSLYDQTQVPSWLKEAAVVHALALMNITTKLGPAEGKSEIANQMLTHVNMTLDPYRRPKGGFRPVGV